MAEAVVLPTTATVMRVAVRGSSYLPPGARLPTGEIFQPSTEDKDEAAKSGNPVRVSVWDKARTSAEQAIEYRNSVAAFEVFLLSVRDVEEVGAMLPGVPMRVVEDPDERYSRLPGGDGHCGIEGLERPPKEAKKLYRSRRDELALRVRPLDDE